AIHSSLEDGAAAMLTELVTADVPPAPALATALAAQIGKQQRPSDVATLLALLATLDTDDAALMTQIVGALDLPADSQLSQQLAAATAGRSAEMIDQLYEKALATLQNGESSEAAQVEAVRLLRLRK